MSIDVQKNRNPITAMVIQILYANSLIPKVMSPNIIPKTHRIAPVRIEASAGDTFNPS